MAGGSHIAVTTTLFTTLSGTAHAFGKCLWMCTDRWYVGQRTYLVVVDSNDSMQ